MDILHTFSIWRLPTIVGIIDRGKFSLENPAFNECEPLSHTTDMLSPWISPKINI